MKILYITHSNAYSTNTVIDYDSSFAKYSKHDIYYFDICKHTFNIDISGFDVLIFSYVFAAFTKDFSNLFKDKIKSFPGLKVFFFQDEYTNFIKHKDNLKALGINAIVTVMPEAYWDAIFGQEYAQVPKLQVLTGYIPDYLQSAWPRRRPLSERKWTIGYRTRSIQPVFGRLCREKVEIGLDMKKFCQQRGVPCNIEVVEEKRIYGKAWPQFIRDCRVMLGSESGCNVFDFDGKIARAIDIYRKKHPDADFWEIHAHCIGPADGKIRTNQISPRIFEAASLGTGHILYEGEYSGILEPWRHYIPLKKDYSNIDEVFEAVADLDFLEKIITTAYEDLVTSGAYSYRGFINRVDAFLEGLAGAPDASEISCISLLERAAPPPLTAHDRSRMQAEETARVREAAQKWAGKKILAYGGGEAFRKYAGYFAQANILGIIIDDCFLAKTPRTGETPFISFAQARELAPEADGCVIFCRMEWCFGMYERSADLFQGRFLPEVCVLYE